MFYSQNPLKSYLIPYTVPTTSKLHKMTGDCNLRDFIIDVNSQSGFRRGHTYYEFTNEVENILEAKRYYYKTKRTPRNGFD
jgi:hypothetical protein